MTDVKKKRMITLKELGLPSEVKDYAITPRISIYFSQDEEYLIMGLSNSEVDKNGRIDYN
jgi:hypothetical protein